MNGTLHPENCIIRERGGIVENRHYIHAAVVDSKGRLLYSVGDPDRTTLVRSAVKPAQALAILETGAFEKYGFDEADLAITCASHNSEEKHVQRVRSMLEKIQAREEHLQCGGHPSNSREINEGWIREGLTPTKIYNNCSGKHAGMLAGAKAIDAGFENYHKLQHPMQQRVKKVVEDLCGRDDVRWAIDGCNLPAPAMSLVDTARMFVKVAGAADSPDEKTGSDASERTRLLARTFHAMSSHPYLVAGSGRFCTSLMDAFEGELIGKVGAEGCYGIAIRASEQTRQMGAEGSVGIAIKVEDGDRDTVYSAAVEILKQLQFCDESRYQQLERFHHPPVLNTMNVVVGKVEHVFRVRGSNS